MRLFILIGLPTWLTAFLAILNCTPRAEDLTKDDADDIQYTVPLKRSVPSCEIWSRTQSHPPPQMSHAPCPMPHAPCSMPHAPCPMPHAPHLQPRPRSLFRPPGH
jgi:hypothetical protein